MKTPAIQTDWVGRVIDERFTLIEWLGGSESSDVFLTEFLGLPWEKASIKLISANDADAEAHIAGWAVTITLSHPHLMHLFHTGSCRVDHTPLIYTVTEYTEEVLSQILPERPLTPAEAGEMLEWVLDALSYLHDNGLVHGHLRPSNIMVVDDQLKLSSDSLHVAGGGPKRSLGSGMYDAPEIATEPISPAADVWSLGVLLVEALTQHPPLWDRYLQGNPVVPQSIPQPFAGIAEACLRADPARRCTLSDIKAILAPPAPLPELPGAVPPVPVPHIPVPPSPVSSSPTSASPAAPAKFDKSASAERRGKILVAAALVLLVIIAAVLLRSQHTQPSPSPGSQPAPDVSKPAPAPATAAPAVSESLPQSPATVTQTSPTQAPAAPGSQGEPGKGEVAERVLPDVLPAARVSIRGQVNVAIRVTVDPGGNVANAAVDSPGASRYFPKVALEAAQRWRFKPAQVGGRSTASVWILKFKFTQSAIDVTPVQVSP
jgi:eukaryotic-like serine/threonine-protein kinase